MTVGFMGLFVALVSEFGELRLGLSSLIAAVLLGAATVFYWAYTDDLRFYAWVQFMPLGVILLLLCLCRSHYSHNWLLVISLICYIAAKLMEHFDAVIYQLSGDLVSGHTLKHLAAALGCYILAILLQKRRPIE